MSYEYVLFDYLGNIRNEFKARPLVLGSNPVTSGTGGGPPGGFIGYLKPERVSFDIVEAENNTIPVSGMSLTTNLNRIRYRIAQLEDNPAITGISVAENGIVIASGIVTLDFVNAGVELTSSGWATVTCSGTGGGGGETTTISGIAYVFNEVATSDGGNFTTSQPFANGTLSVYYNGLKQASDSFTIVDEQTFTLAFPTEASDSINVDYGVHNILFSGTINSGSGTSVHNDLTGLQGGTTDEYYHLTQAQYNTVASGVGSVNIGCRVYRATDQTIANNTDVRISYSNERWDTDSMWDVSDPTKVYINTAGVYNITSQVLWKTTSTNGVRISAILINNQIYAAYDSKAGSTPYQNITTMYNLSADDYVEILVYQTSGGNLDLQSDNTSSEYYQYTQELSVQKIG